MVDWQRSEAWDLTGKKALVIGFANPAGHAIATGLAEAGADVAVAAATADGDEFMAARKASKEVTALGRTTFAQAWDVSLPTNVQVSYKQLLKEFGHPGIVVYNADLLIARSITKLNDGDVNRVLSVNQLGAFNATRTFLRERKDAAEPGRLIYVVSLLGERGLANMSAYAMAKAGVIGLMQSISQEAARDGVTANAISTGWMDWSEGRGPAEIGQNLLMRYVPMRRFGRADELVGLAVLLASNASGFLNGQVFHVDGGVSQHL